MDWITTLRSPGHITEAVTHFNRANEDFEAGRSKVEVARILFDALNKIQTEWEGLHDRGEIGEVKAFQTMILEGFNTEEHIDFLHIEEIESLVFFEPQIMNHKTLRRHRYRPDQEIEPELVNNASQEHRKVVTAYTTYLSQKSDEAKDRVIKRVAELLYVVRSNIAHGEKTPYGPDRKKKERDEKVCNVVIPLQRLLLNVLLDYPDRKLVVYGTLAPVISEIQGIWEECTVNGRLREIKGLPYFVWQPGEPAQKVQILTSSGLPNWWVRLDQFEGATYRRILVPISKSHGIAIAHCYVAAQNLEAR